MGRRIERERKIEADCLNIVNTFAVRVHKPFVNAEFVWNIRAHTHMLDNFAKHMDMLKACACVAN